MLSWAGKQGLYPMKRCCSSETHFHFVSKWRCKLFKIHSLRMMRGVKTGYSVGMRRSEVSLLPWFSSKQGWNSAFASTTMGTGYSGLKTELSLAWHPQTISVLAFMIHKQHSDFAGQMRSFCLWLLVKQPYLDFFQVSWNKYWNSEKSLGLARLEFDFVPWTSDSLGKPLLQITLHFLLWLKRRCKRTCELTYGSLLAEYLP